MKTTLAPETEAFHDVVRSAIADNGGVDIIRRCETDPGQRTPIAEMLARLGVWDLDPRGSEAELEAAAAACRAAGNYGLPYPVAERLARDPDGAFGALAVVGGRSARINMVDLDLDWAAADGDGRLAAVVGTGPRLETKLGTFACDVQLGPWRDHDDGASADLVLLLQSWVLLGMVESAAAQTYRYVQDRIQFGHPLSEFQAVRFRLTDVEVALQALTELAKYTLWSVGAKRDGARADCVALRLAALETADVTFRVGHQLHGAIGFCDETDISWLSRASQPLRRLPWGYSQTEERLLALIDERPFDGLFTADELARVAR
jgi:hypothetical protein